MWSRCEKDVVRKHAVVTYECVWTASPLLPRNPKTPTGSPPSGLVHLEVVESSHLLAVIHHLCYLRLKKSSSWHQIALAVVVWFSSSYCVQVCLLLFCNSTSSLCRSPVSKSGRETSVARFPWERFSGLPFCLSHCLSTCDLAVFKKSW